MSAPGEQVPQQPPESHRASPTTNPELDVWLNFARQAQKLAEQFIALLRLELGLAAADGKRLLLVYLASLPLITFAWLGGSVLMAWLSYNLSASIGLGLVTFTLVQLLALAALGYKARQFKRSLRLPATRRQWQALLEYSGSNKAPTPSSSEDAS